MREFNMARPPAVSNRNSAPSEREVAEIHARRYKRANWATPEGVAAKRRQLEKRGLPSFKGWKFITLTLDRDFFEDENDGYQRGKARLSKFRERCIYNGLFAKDSPGAWKLEFHDDGWPHWHILLKHLPKWTEAEMGKIAKAWKFGRVNIEAVRTSDYLYSFKYAFKAVFQRHDDGMLSEGGYCLPDWFMDRYATREDGKPVTYSRVRFWQTWGDFYTDTGDVERPEKKAPSFSILPRTVREVALDQVETVQVIARTQSGRYLKSALVRCACVAALWTSVAWDFMHGAATSLGVESFMVPLSTLEKQTTIDTWQLKQLARLNRLTAARAATLPPRNWRTC